jgi:predicted metal-dependent hydrolase
MAEAMSGAAAEKSESGGSASKSRSARPPIKPRKMGLSFGPDIPRTWLMKSPLATHLANSLNLLFPLGERFFIRSVRAYAGQIKDPALIEQVRGFIAQEVRHAMEHERFFESMEAQGYSIRRYLEIYERVAYGFLEKITPPKLHLSTTVALEHFTAMFAERALSAGFLDESAHPALRDLLLWHAAEEIEHKCVAFDVLKEVDPSYALRMAGLAMATVTLVGFWMAGAAMLLAQEKDMPPTAIAKHLKVGYQQGRIGNGDMLRAFVEYLRPSFHPADNDNFHLARDYFERVKAAGAGAAY